MRLRVCLVAALMAAMSACAPPGDSRGDGEFQETAPPFELVEVEVPPSRISCPDARLPEELRGSGVEGEVMLSGVLGIDGSIERESIEVVSSEDQRLDQVAIASFSGCRFEPARHKGALVRVLIRQAFDFRGTG